MGMGIWEEPKQRGLYSGDQVRSCFTGQHGAAHVHTRIHTLPYPHTTHTHIHSPHLHIHSGLRIHGMEYGECVSQIPCPGAFTQTLCVSLAIGIPTGLSSRGVLVLQPVKHPTRVPRSGDS